MNNELMEALDLLEREKDISKDTLLDAINLSLITACKNHFGNDADVSVEMDRTTGEIRCFARKTVVEDDKAEDFNASTMITLENAVKTNADAKVGDEVDIEIKSKEFGRIATQNAKNVILQKIREEERKVVYYDYFAKEHDIVTGIVSRVIGKNLAINLGKVDGILSENEQVKTENLKLGDRVKVFVLEVKDAPKGPKISVSRTHPDLVRKLFEAEVSEIKDGTVEIMSITCQKICRSYCKTYQKGYS